MDLNGLVHLNNFIFLVFALCTDSVYDANNMCQDDHTANYLYFILYGNLIVYGLIFTCQTLYYLKLLDTFTKKIGAVVLTIGTYTFMVGVLLFDLISMVLKIMK